MLLLVNGMLAGYALAQNRPIELAGWTRNFLAAAAYVEPVLIASMALLCPLRRALRHVRYATGVAIIAAIAGADTGQGGWACSRRAIKVASPTT